MEEGGYYKLARPSHVRLAPIASWYKMEYSCYLDRYLVAILVLEARSVGTAAEKIAGFPDSAKT